MSIRSQRFSGRSLSAGASYLPASVGFSSFGSQSLMTRGLQSSTGMGSGFGSASGFGVGSGAGLAFGSGFGAGFGAGGGSVSANLRTAGGSFSALGAGSIGASLRSGAGSYAETMSNIINEKQQLQILNDRLATYLEKVKRLETTNHELNEKLRTFAVSRVQSSFNLEPYEIQIKTLREKLLLLIQEHTCISLALDNAKLAVDDFRMKFETELAVRQAVEGDIAGLRTLKTEYDSTNAMLKQEVKGLSEDHIALRNAHQQEIIALRGEMTGTVTVDVKEIESADLSRVLAEIRSEYEAVIEKNRREAVNWYTKQVEKRQAETAFITESTVSGSSEITESQKQTLTLQTQLDSALVKKASLEQHLVEVQAQYQAQLFSLAQLAGGLEGELTAVRESALQQSRNYQLLLSTKVQLEREIATYKGLLEGAGEMGKISVPVTTTALRKMEFVDGASLATAGAVGGVSASLEVQPGAEAPVGGATADAGAPVGGATADAGASGGADVSSDTSVPSALPE